MIMGTRTSRLLSEGDEENNATNSDTCPIYEAALVARGGLVVTISSIMTTDEDEERRRIDKEIDKTRRGRMEWFASLDVLNYNGGGYMQLNWVSCPIIVVYSVGHIISCYRE